MFTFHVEPAARAHGGVMPECCNTTAVSPAERAALSAIERVLKFPHGAAMRCRDLAPVGTSGNRKLTQSSRVAAPGRLSPNGGGWTIYRESSVRNLHFGPTVLAKRRSRVANGYPSSSATATYHAS